VKNVPVMLFATNEIQSDGRLPTVEGNADEVYRLAAEGKGVLASENFARLHGARMGEVLDLPAPSGTLRLPIVGIVRDFSDQQGSLLMSREVFIEHWHDDAVNSFQIHLAPGAD